MSNAPLFELVKEIQVASELTIAVDVANKTFKAVTEVRAVPRGHVAASP